MDRTSQRRALRTKGRAPMGAAARPSPSRVERLSAWGWSSRAARDFFGAPGLLVAAATVTLLLGACGAATPPLGRAASSGTVTSGGTPKLSPSALGPLAARLSPTDERMMLKAMDGLSPSAAGAITTHLDALDAAAAGRLAGDLTVALGADPGGAQDYADTLVGAAGAEAAQPVATREMQAFSQGFQFLPGALSEGNPQIASFVAQILSTTVPHIESLMENALSQVAAPRVPLLLADANGWLHAASANPSNLGDTVALLEDPTALALSQRTAYQAGYACGLTLANTCTAFDRWMLSIAGLQTAPELIQQDIVDCVVLPLCTRTEYQGIVSWADQVAVNSSRSGALIRGLSAEMEANSYLATERWMEAF